MAIGIYVISANKAINILPPFETLCKFTKFIVLDTWGLRNWVLYENTHFLDSDLNDIKFCRYCSQRIGYLNLNLI